MLSKIKKTCLSYLVQENNVNGPDIEKSQPEEHREPCILILQLRSNMELWLKNKEKQPIAFQQEEIRSTAFV